MECQRFCSFIVFLVGEATEDCYVQNNKNYPNSITTSQPHQNQIPALENEIIAPVGFIKHIFIFMSL